MPITKQYLRYVPTTSFNLISSIDSNGTWVTLNNQEGRYIATGACENIFVWDMNLVEKAVVLPGEKTVVTRLLSSPDHKTLAAGFRDGTVKTFDLKAAEVNAVFSGHKTSVTCLAFDNAGHRLASGSNDTNIVVWDMVAESGICRLSGHTAPVTSICFMADRNVLLSASKDTSIKFWDLDTNYCFKTLLGHRTEVWGIVLMRNDEFLVTGCSDSELRVWNLSHNNVDKTKEEQGIRDELNNEEDIEALSPIKSSKCGSILRTETGKVSTVTSDSSGQILAVHGTSGTLELFSFLSHMEALKRLKKRKKKDKKKSSGENEVEDDNNGTPTLQDIVKRLPPIKLKGKIKSSSLVLGKTGELRVLVTLSNNSVEVHTLNVNIKQEEPKFRRKLYQQGHRSEVRVVTFSSDNLAVVTGSADSVKLWNRNSTACLRTISTGYVNTLCMVPGDRHVIGGLKDGSLIIVDLNASDILETIPAHGKEISSICLTPNQRGCVSGSYDCTVKFWDFDLVEDKDSAISAKVLSLLHTRTLKVDEAVLCVKVSPNSKLIAVALLDMTVKIFFLDTLKFFLNLYGHKLVINCMDISSDSNLIVTGSADRNVKIWGLDFGDCHKSIFAHDDSVTSVQFIPKTHYFFSCGKDGKIKQWDADNFQKIITLNGHFGEAWCLSVSSNGEHVASTGSDRVVRLAIKTEEPLILEDEAEEERAREEEEELATDSKTVVKGLGDINLPSRKTVGSEKGAEQILESLEVCRSYLKLMDDYEKQVILGNKKAKKPEVPLLMVAYKTTNIEDFMIEILSKIRSSDLEEVLLLLPFSSVCEMLEMFPALFKQGKSIELIISVFMFLIKIHHGPIVSNRNLLPTIRKVKKLAFKQLNALRDTVGFNLYGLQYLQRSIEQKQGITLFRDATIERKEKAKKRKRKIEATKRAVLTLT
ncbi:hypothetical protein RUM44_006133 [Polyplax serrata]|uniref:Small-subunit processome Utp12 domain-containing protein n=1 Tax=Polyplax serrata TaxID=468196 RepID=A0ABR1AZ68_POLSC